jgi:hypothetical protein
MKTHRMDFERKLRIQFGKALGKGLAENATIDPTPTVELTDSLESGERPIVVVFSKTNSQFWFTDRRLLVQTYTEISELFRYEQVRHTYWMFKDLTRTLIESGDEPGSTSRIKSVHWDRLVVEKASGEVALEGIEEAYGPIYEFLQWIVP